MKQAVVLLAVVAFVAVGSAKPYEPYRKPSAPNQYPFYGPNFLYGTDRVSEDFLRRLFAQRPKDEPVDVQPNGQLSDVDERLWQLLVPQGNQAGEVDAEEREPLKEEKQPGAPDVQEEQVDSEKSIEKGQEKTQKPGQEPKESDQDKEKQEQKPDQEPKEGDKDKGKQEQKPDQKPKDDDKDKEKQQQKPDQKPKEDDKRQEKEHGDKVKKPNRGPGGHPIIPRPNKGNRPEGRKPFEDRARRPGQEHPRGDRDKPESPPRRQPQSPLVQINVNVGAPVI